MILLGVDCLIERVKRWIVSCGVDRESRAGKRMQPIVGRTRNSRVLLYRLRFASRFGKLRHHNSDTEEWYPGKNDQKKRGPDPTINGTNLL